MAQAFADEHHVTLAAPMAGALLPRAAALGYAIKEIDPGDEAGLRRWLKRAGFDLIHLHAGIGWEGHALARAAGASGTAIVRTEHLPNLLTCSVQQAEYHDGAALADRLLCVSKAVADSRVAAGVAPEGIVTILNGVAARATARPAATLCGNGTGGWACVADGRAVRGAKGARRRACGDAGTVGPAS
nr:glycosyltransferase family 4 protein [Sphingomonas bacterium]